MGVVGIVNHSVHSITYYVQYFYGQLKMRIWKLLNYQYNVINKKLTVVCRFQQNSETEKI